METLLDAADALARSSHEPERPHFSIPPEVAVMDPSVFLELRDSEKGKGWFAKRDLVKGTRIMVTKPIAMVMNWQDKLPEGEEDGDTEQEAESNLNEFLILEILELLKQDPSLWDNQISHLYPRMEELDRLPVWVCHDDNAFLEIEDIIAELGKTPALAGREREISRRLPQIVRYNVLSVETCPELLSHPGHEGHSSISGVGLYHLPSFFNHSSRPNCNRFCIGDVMFFLVNQNVASDQEICISYIEHDTLCEPVFRRNELISMDFTDLPTGESFDGDVDMEDGPILPVVDSDVQNELMGMNPLDRITSIDELLSQATGQKGAEDELEIDGESHPRWYECDIQNLRILKAITLESLGKYSEALILWKDSAEFVEKMMPPLDENSVVIYSQIALCAHQCNMMELATEAAKTALTVHDTVFSGGVSFFRRRMRADLRLSFRVNHDIDTVIDKLWPL